MDHAQSSYSYTSIYESTSSEISCSTYKPHFFWGSFETFQVACYGRDLATLLVAQESKLCSGESKMFHCLYSSYRAQFLSDLLYPLELSGGYFGLVYPMPLSLPFIEIFVINALRRKLHQLGSLSLQDIFIGR